MKQKARNTSGLSPTHPISSHPSESRQLMSEQTLELGQYTYPKMA